LSEESQKKQRCANCFWSYVDSVGWWRAVVARAVVYSSFCGFAVLSLSIMALTKICSTVHFVSRGATLGGRGGAASGHWVPNTDVYATDSGLVIKVELAGMKSDGLEITVEGNRLRVAGNRPDGCRAGGRCNFLVMEISYGPFESTLELPPGYDLSRAKAVYVNGFLRIDVPVALQPHSKVPITKEN
jgi:HSP20 family protein